MHSKYSIYILLPVKEDYRIAGLETSGMIINLTSNPYDIIIV